MRSTAGRNIPVLAILLWLIIFPAQTKAATSEEKNFGVNISLELRFEQSEESTVMAKLNELGLSWVREEFNWNVIEPSQGNFDWNGYDRTMQLYKNADINVLGVLAYSAEWASTAPANVSFRDKYAPDNTAWKNYVTAVVSRYPEIKYWEVWNEPNHESFLIAADRVDTYKTILTTASQAIRAANPQAKVLIGGLSGADADFVRRLYKKGAKGLFDIVAIHPYRTISGKSVYAPETTEFGLNSLATDLYIMRSTIHAYDPVTTPPIWITELGWPTDSRGVSEITQANYLQRGFLLSKTYPEVQKIFWYNLRDDSATDEEDKYFGLYAYDWRAKPSVNAMKQLTVNYPTLSVKEDMEAFSKPIEEFADPGRVSVEAFDNGQFIRRETVTARPALHALRGSGSINYRYAFANNRIIQYRRLSIKGLPRTRYETYDLWLWSDGGIHPVRLRFKDASGEIFQGNAGSTGYGWIHLTISLKNTANFVSWGGDNDKKIDYPVTFDSIILEKNPDSPLLKGNIVLSHLTYRRFDQAYSLRFQQDGRNRWVFWKMNGNPQPATVYAPLTRLMNIGNWADMGFRTLAPQESIGRKIIMFGLEEKPIFVE